MTTTPQPWQDEQKGRDIIAELATASPEALLDATVQLTHKIHTISVYKQRGIDALYGDMRLADLREQRAMIHAEILRRIGRPARGSDGRWFTPRSYAAD